ncbi:hypothetical protein AB0O01_35075 [Streptomyces sp. NPDC093252]|uniref:hypothetical protein n=1 Tax=Streptomyces sp. NPDC093252 TaxID=3154980 RepID=UPI00341C84E5
MAARNAPPFLVLHDLDAVKAEITEALATADETRRPGLEAAARIVDRHLTHSDEQRTRDWVRRFVQDSGLDAERDQVRAVKALREAVPGLGLIAANDLVTSVTSVR